MIYKKSVQNTYSYRKVHNNLISCMIYLKNILAWHKDCLTWIITAALVCLLKRSSLRAAIPRIPVWMETAEEYNSL